MPSSIPMPSKIRALAKQAGIPLPMLSGADAASTTSGTYMTPELKAAYWAGDYDTINRQTSLANDDLSPIYENIKQNQKKAFALMQDDDGTPYYLSISGNANNPTGYMWTYCPPAATTSATVKDDPTYDPVVTCGTLSMSSSILGVSSWIYTSKLFMIPTTLASVVMGVFVKTVYKTLMGQALDDAAAEAGVEVSAELVADGTIAVGLETTIAIGLTAVVGGLVIGAIIFFLMMFLFQYIFKNFQLQFRLFNWSTTLAWNITHEWGSNEECTGAKGFQPSFLDLSIAGVRLPNGYLKPGTEHVSYSNYVFTNDSSFMQGVGVALNLACSDGNGFQIKYVVHYASDNQMGFSSNLNQSLEDFYNSGWLGSETMQYVGTVSGNNTPVFITTPKLGGGENDIYYCDVHIGRTGAPATNKHLAASDNKSTLKQEHLAERMVVLKSGDKLKLPDGSMAVVAK